MRKQMIRMAALICVAAMSLIPVRVAAAPSGAPQALESGTDAYGEGKGNAEGTDDGVPQAVTETGSQGHMTAEDLKAEKRNTPREAAAGTEKDEDGLDPGCRDEKPSYTAPEDSRRANVSFSFTEAASSAFFSKLSYPLSMRLKEVDTGARVTLTVKSDGQILEVEKGDYIVTFLKDSGKIPLSVAGDTLHIYKNTEYPVRFAANNGLRMFTDFLADNIFLACFFIFAALFYKKVIIPRFASDAKRR